uniref:CCC1 n=1 Tax=Arundo donax TaxID=35708 RepID=A0A0A9HHG0_ARUDO
MLTEHLGNNILYSFYLDCGYGRHMAVSSFMRIVRCMHISNWNIIKCNRDKWSNEGRWPLLSNWPCTWSRSWS